MKEINKSEIEKFCEYFQIFRILKNFEKKNLGSVADGASKVMVVLLINDEAEDEASQEVSHEMKRQFFHKIQDFQLGRPQNLQS